MFFCAARYIWFRLHIVSRGQPSIMGSKELLTTPRTDSIFTASVNRKPPQNSRAISTFRSAVYKRLDNPLTSLFRLGIRVLQLIFALASGISYAIELANGNHESALIYSQVVFGLTTITIIVDAVTLRSYRLTFMVESTLCILWLALFGVFYTIYLSGTPIEVGYENADLGRMKRAVWVDMINFLLWLASALFSTVMCCTGIKGAIKGKIERRRQRKNNRTPRDIENMEAGIERPARQGTTSERLPLYEEIVAAARAG